jgi:hypothetical protein
MVTEQNKDDLLEVMYRMGASQINKVVLLAVVKIQFDHWENDIFWDTAKALEDDKLIVLRSPTGHAALTLDGRRRVEDRLYPSPAFTQNIVNTDTITNSPIQQGGAYANMTQTVSYSREDLDDLRRLVEMFDAHLDDLNLDAAAKQKAMVQVATIKAQLQDDPDPVIVKQAGRTLRNVTEGAIGSLLANAVQPAVWALASLFIAKLFGGP